MIKWSDTGGSLYLFAENPAPRWDEQTSQKFLDYGRYFVPERELQMGIMLALLISMYIISRRVTPCSAPGWLQTKEMR